jgi:hypothetical protein
MPCGSFQIYALWVFSSYALWVFSSYALWVFSSYALWVFSNICPVGLFIKKNTCSNLVALLASRSCILLLHLVPKKAAAIAWGLDLAEGEKKEKHTAAIA